MICMMSGNFRACLLVVAALAVGACGSGGQEVADAAADTTPDATIVPPPDLEQLVEDYENQLISRDEFRAGIALIPDTDRPSTLSGSIDETTLLKLRAQPYQVEADLSVAEDVILVIEPGVELVFAFGVSLNVNGRLYAIGSDSSTVVFRAGPGDFYNAIVLHSGPNQLVSVEFDRGNRNLVAAHPFDTHTLVESARFDAWVDIAVDQVASSGLHILRADFGYQTDPADVSGETIRSRNSGVITIEESTFNYRRGYRDVIDLQDCVADYWPVIIHNRFDGGEDDAVDLDACSAFVIGNHIRDFTPLDLDTPVGGVNGGGITGDQVSSKPIIINNFIDNCYHGIGFKNGASPTIYNNTIINSNIGISLYQSAVGQPVPHGVVYNNVLANNLGWLNGGLPQDIVLNGKWWPSYNQVDDVQATIDARFNITASSGIAYPGDGNSGEQPLVAVIDGVPTLMAGSPGIGTGADTLPLDSATRDQVIEFLRTDFAGNSRAESAGVFPNIDRGAVQN